MFGGPYDNGRTGSDYDEEQRPAEEPYNKAQASFADSQEFKKRPFGIWIICIFCLFGAVKAFSGYFEIQRTPAIVERMLSIDMAYYDDFLIVVGILDLILCILLFCRRKIGVALLALMMLFGNYISTVRDMRLGLSDRSEWWTGIAFVVIVQIAVLLYLRRLVKLRVLE